MICESEMTVGVTTVDPKCTAVAPVKSVPLIVTVVPPVVGPEFGVIEVMIGSLTNTNGDPLLVPYGVETEIFSVPVPAGDTAVICDDESKTMLEAGVVPNKTVVRPVK